MVYEEKRWIIDGIGDVYYNDVYWNGMLWGGYGRFPWYGSVDGER